VASVDTHCPYCALQCAMTLTRTTDDRGLQLVSVQGRDFPTNRGGLCQKGWTSAAVLGAPDRLTTPLLRGADGTLQPATWEEAMTRVVDAVSKAQAEHGRDSVAVFGGGGLTNEKAYLLGRFARTVLRTANIDYNGRFCMSSAAAAANRSLGIDRGLPFPLADLGGASAILLLGSNLADTMPPAVAHLAGARARGGLVVVDPRRSATAQLTDDGAGIHLAPVPGTDLVVLLALLHLVLAQGLADEEYLSARTTGSGEVLTSVSAWWPERAEIVCGVPADDLRRVAKLLAEASPGRGGAGAMILTGRGVEQSSQGTDTVTAAINLALALGLPGRANSGYGAITGQGNGQGGREHGQKADQLPGYRRIDDPAAREHVAAVWGVKPDSLPGPGLPAVKLLQNLGKSDGPRVLLVHGSNLAVSGPRVGAVRERLRSLDLLVVTDVVPSETALMADVVLPTTQWAEEEGTMTSLEGRVIRRRKLVEPPGEARSELLILADLAARLGTPGLPTSPSVIFAELARASAGGKADYGAISHERLDAGEALYWPCPVGDEAGTPRLFEKEFPTSDGRARMLPVRHVGPSDELTTETPNWLVTGRVLAHYQSGAQTRRVDELRKAAPDPRAEMHPLLADAHGIEDGAWVRLSTARGSVVVRARLTPSIRPDTVFLPFHWGGAASANLLTTDATDPISGMPEFKVSAVHISPEQASFVDSNEVTARV
jgi:assimilatory nitrate reductase catalytic subunit